MALRKVSLKSASEKEAAFEFITEAKEVFRIFIIASRHEEVV